MRNWAVVALALSCHRQPTAADAGRELATRWADVDRAGRPFWTCLLAREVELGAMQNGQQIRRLVEQAYESAEKTFADQVLGKCLPALKVWRAQALPDAGQLRDSAARYAASLANIEAALRVYGERLKGRVATEIDEEMGEKARAWHAAARPTPASIAYDRFLRCAIPSLDTLASGQAVYDYLAKQCFEQNPLPFVERVRKECGPLLEESGERAARGYQATWRRLRDPEGRQAQSWDGCTDLAREQRGMSDASELVAALEQYLPARRALVGTAGPGAGPTGP
jgi:hypothetical protein